MKEKTNFAKSTRGERKYDYIFNFHLLIIHQKRMTRKSFEMKGLHCKEREREKRGKGLDHIISDPVEEDAFSQLLRIMLIQYADVAAASASVKYDLNEATSWQNF